MQMDYCLKSPNYPGSNSVHQTLGIRLLGRSHPSLLTNEQQRQYDAYLERVFSATPANALQDHQGHKKLTLEEAFAETNKLLQEATSPQEQVFLQALKTWYESKRMAFMAEPAVTQVGLFSGSARVTQSVNNVVAGSIHNMGGIE